MQIFNNNNGGSSSGYPFFPFFETTAEGDSLKNAHDAYDVYVNDEYIGKKVLLTQAEEIDDVLDFLKVQGVKDVSGRLDGDHYMIKSEDSEQVKNMIETYLQNR